MRSRRPLYYRRDGTPIPEEVWVEGFGSENRTVAKDLLPDGKRVSTVFLGMDHNFYGDGPPLIFETMVFPAVGYIELDMCRYSTEAEAVAGHQKMVEKWSKKDFNRPRRIMRATNAAKGEPQEPR
jgi:hypothetical protein